MIVSRCVDPRRLTVGPAHPRRSLHIAMGPGGYRQRRSAPKGQQKVEYVVLESLVFFDSSCRARP